MEAQAPAEGILLHKDWGDSQAYEIPCNCGCDDHTHNLWVEADDAGVSITIYSKLSTDFWKENVEPRYDIENELLQWYNWFWTGIWNGICTRLRLTKEIWFNGYAKYESTLCMSRQQTVNYAETLLSAMHKVEEFRKNKNVRNK